MVWVTRFEHATSWSQTKRSPTWSTPIYKKLVKFLGGNIDKDYKKIIDKWYDKRRKEDEEIEAKKKADEEIIKNLSLDIFSIFTINSQVGFELSKIQTKINEMCGIIRELKRNKF